MARDPLDNILNDCLDRLRRGETLAECVARYPDRADELRPLLETAATLMTVRVPMRPAHRAEARHRFQGAVRANLARREARSSRWSGLSTWTRAWAGTAAALLLTVGLGTGTVLASSDATPDGLLYPIKRAAERARVAVTFSEAARAQLHLELADRRGIELAAMAQAGKAGKVEKLGRDLVRELDLARAEAGVVGGSSTVMVAMPVEGGAGGAAAMSQMAPAPVSAPSAMMNTASARVEGTQRGVPPSGALGIESVPQSFQTKAVQPGEANPMPVVVREEPPDPYSFKPIVRDHGEKNVARLTLAMRRATAEARAALAAALKAAKERYAGGEAPYNLEQRILVLRGVAVSRDGALWVGGRRVELASDTQIHGGKPQAGRMLIAGGILQDDGALLALEIETKKVDSSRAPTRIAIQGLAAQDAERTIIVGGYRISYNRERTKFQGDWEEAHWLLVEGTATTPHDINAERVVALDGGPAPFEGQD